MTGRLTVRQVVAWVVIVLVTVFDMGFAWYFRDTFSEWELNPVACWCYHVFGFYSLPFLRVFGITLFSWALVIDWYASTSPVVLNIPVVDPVMSFLCRYALVIVLLVHVCLVCQYAFGLVD